MGMIMIWQLVSPKDQRIYKIIKLLFDSDQTVTINTIDTNPFKITGHVKYYYIVILLQKTHEAWLQKSNQR